MIHVGNRKELITSTDAFMIDPYTVRMAGEIFLPVKDFDKTAKKLVSLASDTPEHAALAVATQARGDSGAVIVPPGK